MSQFTDNVTLLDAVTATTTSATFDISKRSRVGIVLLAASITSGSGIFTVDLSNDGTNWIQMAAMQDAQATASTTWVTSKTLNANTTAGLLLPRNGWKAIRINVVRATDGAYTAIMESGE